MKKHRKFLVCILIALCFCFLCATPAFAVTEEEVQQQVDSVGKEAVSGNIFIWFLCAIAFLKASQKIDSFMSSLGINVGHTGGSMLAEAMIAARGVSAVKGGIGGIKGAFGGGSGGGGAGEAAAGFMAGGLAGAVGRHFSQSAAGSVTGQSSGLAAGISRKMFNSSLAKGGEFANNVIGSVAKGRVSAAGTMTGTTAAAAMSSYFGGGQHSAAAGSGIDGGGSDAGEAPGVSYTGGSEMDDPDIGVDGGGYVPTAGGFAGSDSSGYVGGGSTDTDSIPTYSDVEIGGGRVTGRETSVSEPEGIDFAMYSMDQYSKPQGDYSVVQAADGSKWYKQYAKDTVDRTPYMDEEGEIKFTEKIIKAVPRPPMRKDRQ